MKLDEIATLTVGQILTRVTNQASEYTYKVLQPKAIENGAINDQYIDNIMASKKIDSDKLTREGDVIIKLSTPYEAVVIDEQHKDLVIPSFCAVLRAEQGFDPFYICAIINSSYVKDQLKSRIAGTARPMVKISDLRIVDVPIVQNEKMLSIGREYALSLRKLELLSKIINIEKDIMDNKVLSIVVEAEKNE